MTGKLKNCLMYPIVVTKLHLMTKSSVIGYDGVLFNDKVDVTSHSWNSQKALMVVDPMQPSGYVHSVYQGAIPGKAAEKYQCVSLWVRGMNFFNTNINWHQ